MRPRPLLLSLSAGCFRSAMFDAVFVLVAWLIGQCCCFRGAMLVLVQSLGWFALVNRSEAATVVSTLMCMVAL